MASAKLNANDEARIYDHEGRISAIESDIKFIKKDIGDIKNNHLKHIEKDVAELKGLAAKFLGIIAAGLFLIELLARYIFI